jgi:yeast amino acid transporter
MAEKGVSTGTGGEKDYEYGGDNRRRSSAVNPEVLAGEIFDERYEKTQRGLKSR